jgi:hypothetical protein
MSYFDIVHSLKFLRTQYFRNRWSLQNTFEITQDDGQCPNKNRVYRNLNYAATLGKADALVSYMCTVNA